LVDLATLAAFWPHSDAQRRHWPSWYPIRPVLGKLVSVRGAYEATSFGAESENQVRMAFEPDEPRDDMWFLLFYDPEGYRRILLSTFPRDGIFGTFVSRVYPAPYDEDPTFLAMEKCPEIEKRFADDIARSSQDSPGNEEAPPVPCRLLPSGERSDRATLTPPPRERKVRDQLRSC
jgi:hypothetical protein